MTEAEWLSSEDPARMVAWLTTPASCAGRPWSKWRPSERKLRLFADACRHLFYHGHLIQQGTWSGWESDSCLSSRLRDEGLEARVPARSWAAGCSVTEAPRRAALLRDIIGNPFRPVSFPQPPLRRHWKIHGEFHTDCSWLTPDVLSLAQVAYEERVGRKCEVCKGTGKVRPQGWGDGRGGRDYDAWAKCNDGRPGPSCRGKGHIEDGTLDPLRLAVLADALEEAGCTDEVILRHLRGPGPHVRGCHVLDLLLGKE